MGKKIVFIFLLILFSFSFVSAGTTVLYGDSEDSNYLDVLYNNPNLVGFEQNTVVIGGGSVADIWVDETGDTMTGDLTLTGATTHLIVPSNNDDVTPTLAFGNGDSGFYEYTDDQIFISMRQNDRWRFTSTTMGASASGRAQMTWDGATNTVPTLLPSGSDVDTGIGGSTSSDQLSLIAGGVEGMRLVEATGVVKIGIGTASPSYPLEVNANVSGISIWSQANISATGYNTRTSVFDTSKNAMDYIQDASYYIDSKTGLIQHNKFYGYAGEFEITDYSKPVEEEYIGEVCEEDEKTFEMICTNQTLTRTIYPYTKTEGQISLGSEIDVLRQAVYEMGQELCLMGRLNYC